MARRSTKGINMAAMAKALGLTAEDIKESMRALPKDNGITQTLQLEATLQTLAYPAKKALPKTCKRCGESFYTTYAYVAYCSDECRRIELYKSYGIQAVDGLYHGKSGEQIWSGRVPPGIIPPEALAVMKFLVKQAEDHSGHEIEPWCPEPSEPTSTQKVSSGFQLAPAELSPEETATLRTLYEDSPKESTLSELLDSLSQGLS